MQLLAGSGMILTRNHEEAAAAWDRGEVRAPYASRDAFLAFCADVQAWCAATGRNEFGSSATVTEAEQHKCL